MTILERTREKIKHLYETNPHVHVNVSISHPKIELKNDPAVIKGVYPHVFRIEETSNGVPQYHTLQYTDVLTGQIEIAELNEQE